MNVTTAAYRAGGARVSSEAFYGMACDPHRSVVVEACAGAGKTWMLVSRILRALLDGAQPQEILAITFTRKASGEMRDRLDELLQALADPGCSDAQRAQELIVRGLPAAQAAALAPALGGLQERLLDAGRAVEVRTFHAWFAQLLRAAPLELLAGLGLQRDMVLVEDVDEHRDAVMRRFHAVLLREPALRADHAALIAQRGRSQVAKWLDAAWSRRIEVELADEAGVLDHSVASAAACWPVLAGLAHPVLGIVSAPWTALLVELAQALGRGNAHARKAADGLTLAWAQSDPQLRFDAVWRALFTDTGGPRKLGDVAGLDAAQASLQTLAAQVRQQEAHVEHGRMVRLARVLLGQWAIYKRSRGLADMADLERCALALLRDATLAGWVQERLDARVRHLLIDEFQDTSPLQWHALQAWLAGYAGAGGGASGQRSLSVFIVGDPKQSIYRFRRAEPRVFDAARAFVVDGLGGLHLEADHTRRNAPGVLAVVNEVFSTVQPGEFEGFRRHTTPVAPDPGPALTVLPIVARPPREPSARGGATQEWRDSLRSPRHEAELVLREQEARQVAEAIAGLVRDEGFAPAQIMVLARKRESLRLAAAALRALHLRAENVEAAPLLDAPEARDLLAVLDVLASPGHRLSLAQALRCPLFGVSDADLVVLAERAAGDGDWWSALVAAPHDSAALQRAALLLQRWSIDAQQLPPHDLLDRIVAQGEYRERVAAAVPAAQRIAALAAIDAMLAQALLLDGGRYATPYTFVRALKRRSVPAPAVVSGDAVRLLTVHGAKGLEARAVFVMDADPEPRQPDTATLLIDWPVASERPTACAFVYAESRCPPSLLGLLAREVAARQREELNGLYVALTRAEARLVFSATAPSRPAAARSWWQRIEALPAALRSPPRTAARASVDDGAAPLPGPHTVSLVVLPPRVIDLAAAAPVSAAAEPLPDAGSDAASRLGQAVHRVLEWATSGLASPDLAALAEAAAHDFSAPMDDVERLAQRILHSVPAARFFRGPGILWAGNEVAVAESGEVLRIDRLVQLDDAAGPQWWVLDYKIQQAPQQLPSYREQLRRYRRAVQALQPDAPVHCAFLTGAGEVVLVD